MNDLEDLHVTPKNRSKKEPGIKGTTRWNKIRVMFLLATVLGVFVFTSCEEENSNVPGWEGEESVLGMYAHETLTMHAISGDQVYIQPGSLPFLETGRDSFSLEGMMLFVPDRAMEEGVAPSEMMALFPVQEEERPVHIPKMDMTSKKANGSEPMWWSFSGSQFFPSETFIEEEIIDFIGSWVPDSLEDMQILVYNGQQDPGILFGDTDWSDQAVEMATTIESEKEQLAVAVPFDRLANFTLELKYNLAEVIHEDPAKIEFPVEKGFVNPKPTMSFFSGITVQDGTGSGEEFGNLIGPGYLSEKGFKERFGQVTMIDGRNFFPNSTFTPSTVSVFTIPIKELFPSETFMPYEGSSGFAGSRLLLFGSDYFGEAPNSKWTVHPPNEEMDVSNTRVMLPNSILAAGGEGTSAKAFLPPSRRALGSSAGETFFPNSTFYPVEFNFTDNLYMPDKKFHFTRPNASYSATSIQEMGVMVQPEGLR